MVAVAASPRRQWHSKVHPRFGQCVVLVFAFLMCIITSSTSYRSTIVTPASAALLASSQLQLCTNDGSEEIPCTKKFVVSLSIDGGQDNTESVVYWRSAKAMDSTNLNLKDAVTISVKKSTPMTRYPLVYRTSFNSKPYEKVVPAGFMQCSTSGSGPTCGTVVDNSGQQIPYSEGYCCDCKLCAMIGFCDPPPRVVGQCQLVTNGASSAVCLRMGPIYYGAYEVEPAETWYTITVTISVGEGANKKTTTILLGPDVLGGKDASYGVSARLIGDFAAFRQAPTFASKLMLAPASPINNERVLAPLPSEWLFVEKSMITMDGSECGKVGVSYNGFNSQGERCQMLPGSCTENQIDDLRESDLAKAANGLAGEYMVSNFGQFVFLDKNGNPSTSLGRGFAVAEEEEAEGEYDDGVNALVASEGFSSLYHPHDILSGYAGPNATALSRQGPRMFNDAASGRPYLAYTQTSVQASYLTLTFAADSMAFVVNVSPGQLLYVNVSDFEEYSRNGKLVVTIMNTGNITADYQLSVTGCTASVFPVAATIVSIAARQAVTRVISLSVSAGVTAVTKNYCDLILYNSGFDVVDKANITFITTAVITNSPQTPGTDTGSKDGVSGGSQGSGDKSCSNCPIINPVCFITNKCFGALAAQLIVFVIIGAIIAFCIRYREQLMTCGSFIIGFLRNKGNGDSDDEDDGADKRRRRGAHRRCGDGNNDDERRMVPYKKDRRRGEEGSRGKQRRGPSRGRGDRKAIAANEDDGNDQLQLEYGHEGDDGGTFTNLAIEGNPNDNKYGDGGMTAEHGGDYYPEGDPHNGPVPYNNLQLHSTLVSYRCPWDDPSGHYPTPPATPTSRRYAPYDDVYRNDPPAVRQFLEYQAEQRERRRMAMAAADAVEGSVLHQQQHEHGLDPQSGALVVPIQGSAYGKGGEEEPSPSPRSPHRQHHHHHLPADGSQAPHTIRHPMANTSDGPHNLHNNMYPAGQRTHNGGANNDDENENAYLPPQGRYDAPPLPPPAKQPLQYYTPPVSSRLGQAAEDGGAWEAGVGGVCGASAFAPFASMQQQRQHAIHADDQHPNGSTVALDPNNSLVKWWGGTGNTITTTTITTHEFDANGYPINNRGSVGGSVVLMATTGDLSITNGGGEKGLAANRRLGINPTAAAAQDAQLALSWHEDDGPLSMQQLGNHHKREEAPSKPSREVAPATTATAGTTLRRPKAPPEPQQVASRPTPTPLSTQQRPPLAKGSRAPFGEDDLPAFPTPPPFPQQRPPTAKAREPTPGGGEGRSRRTNDELIRGKGYPLPAPAVFVGSHRTKPSSSGKGSSSKPSASNSNSGSGIFAFGASLFGKVASAVGDLVGGDDDHKKGKKASKSSGKVRSSHSSRLSDSGNLPTEEAIRRAAAGGPSSTTFTADPPTQRRSRPDADVKKGPVAKPPPEPTKAPQRDTKHSERSNQQGLRSNAPPQPTARRSGTNAPSSVERDQPTDITPAPHHHAPRPIATCRVPIPSDDRRSPSTSIDSSGSSSSCSSSASSDRHHTITPSRTQMGRDYHTPIRDDKAPSRMVSPRNHHNNLSGMQGSDTSDAECRGGPITANANNYPLSIARSSRATSIELSAPSEAMSSRQTSQRQSPTRSQQQSPRWDAEGSPQRHSGPFDISSIPTRHAGPTRPSILHDEFTMAPPPSSPHHAVVGGNNSSSFDDDEGMLPTTAAGGKHNRAAGGGEEATAVYFDDDGEMIGVGGGEAATSGDDEDDDSADDEDFESLDDVHANQQRGGHRHLAADGKRPIDDCGYRPAQRQHRG